MFKVIVSNADKIRRMSDEDLAKELLAWFDAFYNVEWNEESILEFLKQECELK